MLIKLKLLVRSYRKNKKFFKKYFLKREYIDCLNFPSHIFKCERIAYVDICILEINDFYRFNSPFCVFM